LQLYANQFWFRHLLDYCRLQSNGNLQIAQDLLIQLEMLQNFEKDPQVALHVPQDPALATQLAELDVLLPLPSVKSLISKLIIFRSSLNRDDMFNTTPAGKFDFYASTFKELI